MYFEWQEQQNMDANAMDDQNAPSVLLFSIIITCYNYEKYITACIDSALSQDYEHFEVIVINDGSTDKSWLLISEYEKELTAISTHNQGFIKACLLGFSKAKGSHVMFLDADDVLHPRALSCAAHFMTSLDTSKIQFMMQPIDEEGKEIGEAFPQINTTEDAEYFRRYIMQHGCYPTPPTSGNIYRRDIYEMIGEIDYDYGIDGVAYLFSPFVGNVIHIPEVLASYRIHGSNMSMQGGLSPEIFARNYKVFLMRLEHLNRLIDRYSPSFSKVNIHRNFQYLIECHIYQAVSLNQTLELRLLVDYWKGRSKNGSFLKKALLFIYLLLVYTFPKNVSKKLILFRLKPTSFPRIRNAIKRLSHA